MYCIKYHRYYGIEFVPEDFMSRCAKCNSKGFELISKEEAIQSQQVKNKVLEKVTTHGKDYLYNFDATLHLSPSLSISTCIYMIDVFYLYGRWMSSGAVWTPSAPRSFGRDPNSRRLLRASGWYYNMSRPLKSSSRMKEKLEDIHSYIHTHITYILYIHT